MQVAPIAEWTEADVDAYLPDHALPRHPLKARGYSHSAAGPALCPSNPGSISAVAGGRETDNRECGLNLLPFSDAHRQ